MNHTGVHEEDACDGGGKSGMVGAFSSCVCAVCSDVQRYTVPDCTVSGSVCTGEKLCAREGIPQVQDAGGPRQRIGNDP